MKMGRLILVSGTLAALAGGAALIAWRATLPPSRGIVGKPLLNVRSLNDVGLVLIENHTGQVLLRWGEQGWTVDQEQGFPADVRKLRALLLKMMRTRISETVAVRPERLADFSLLRKVENDWKYEPDKTALVISIVHGLERRHRLIYRLLVGKERQARIQAGRPVAGHGGTYVRFPDTSRMYLIGDRLAPSPSPQDWIVRDVFPEAERDALRSIRIGGNGRRAFTLFRPEPGAPWRLEGAPLAPDGAERARRLANGIFGLRISRVIRRRKGSPLLAPPGPGRIEVTLADRREYVLDLGAPNRPEGHRTLTLNTRMRGALAEGAARERMEAFNQRFAPWVVAVAEKDAAALLPVRAEFQPPSARGR